MCGIAGTTSADHSVIQAMLDRIAHRGPDAHGIYGIHGHVRLSLQDLSSASNQPFIRGATVLAFNGEIWNFRELRKHLEDIGEIFKTSGDTEVLAAMMARYGLEALNRLDGMFSFSWSSATGANWLIRDQFGKIPLYVAKAKDGYIWASERKAFQRGLVPIAVPPGHAFNLDTGEWLQWYRMPRTEPIGPDKVLSLLEQGVVKRLSADAPVCCLISGGLDSSLILTLARKHRKDITAYIAKFDEQSEDLKTARRLCHDLDVKLIEVPVEVNTRAIEAAMYSIEIPSKAQIEIGVLCLPLAERLYADGFRACLSGEAADELFGGYGNFCIAASRVDNMGVVELRRQQLAKMARGNFIRCNKAFMARSIECRLPFMEQGLVEAAIQMGKADSPPNKLLLKEAAKGLIPGWIVKRPKDTFQGGSGVADKIGSMIASPVKYYNNEIRRLFGYLPEG